MVPRMRVDRAAGLRMWADYLAAHPGLPPEDEPAVEAFGDGPDSPTSWSPS